VLFDGPEAKVPEELCEGVGLVMGVEAARIGKHPGVTTAEEILLQSDASILDSGNDAVRPDADKGNDRRTPTPHLGLKALTAGAQFVGGQFVGAGGGTFDNVRNAELEVEKESILKRRQETRRETAFVQRSPEAVSGASKVTADGGCIEPRVDAGEKHNEIFGDQIRDTLGMCREELSFSRFPGSWQCPIHKATSEA
jgi:hypothetical protein